MTRYFVVLLFLFLSACKNSSTNVEDPQPNKAVQVAPFTLERATHFDNRPIQSVYVSSQGQYYVGTLEGIYVHLPQYGQFGAVDNVFTRVITRMKEFNVRIYAINSTTDAIVSSPDGLHWIKEVQAGSEILDFCVTPDDVIVMLTQQGIFTQRQSEDESIHYQFENVPTMGVYIGSVTQSSSGILFVGTTLGLFKSADQGQSWAKLSNETDDFGKINLVFTDRDDRLLVVEDYTSMFASTDQGGTWSQLPDLANDGYQLIQNSDNRFYLLTSYGVYMTNTDTFDFERLSLQDYTELGYVLQDFSIRGNRIILSDGLSIYFGTINWQSTFWDDWEK